MLLRYTGRVSSSVIYILISRIVFVFNLDHSIRRPSILKEYDRARLSVLNLYNVSDALPEIIVLLIRLQWMNKLSTLRVILGKDEPYPVAVKTDFSNPMSSLKSPVLKSNWYPVSKAILTRNNVGSNDRLIPLLE